MRNADAAPMMVINGDPGTGKSSLLHRIAEGVQEDRLLAWVSRAPDRADPFDALSLLSAVIDGLTSLGIDADESVNLPPSSGVNVTMHVDEIQSGGMAIANVIKLTTAGGLLPVAERLVRSVPSTLRTVLIIDALDQAEDEDAVEFLTVTAALLRAARKSGVRILCASRRKLPVSFDQSLATAFDLSLDAPEEEDELREYLSARFEELQPEEHNRVVESILDGANGNWLWAATNADSLEVEIQEQGRVPDTLPMTEGLGGLYGDGVRRMKQRLQDDWTSFGRQLLTVVSCSLDEHLTIAELRWITGESTPRIEDVAEACEPFLRRTEDGVRLFHPDFARWILAGNVEGISEEDGHLAVAQGFTELGRATHWGEVASNAATRVIEHWCQLLVLDPFSPELREHEEEIGKVLMEPAWVARARLGLDAIEQAALMAPTLRFPQTKLPLATGLRILHESSAARLLVGREISAKLSDEKLEELNELIDTPAFGVRWLEKELEDYDSITMRTLWGRVVREHVTVGRSNGELRAAVSVEGFLSSLEELDPDIVNWLIELSKEIEDGHLDHLVEGVQAKFEETDAGPRRLLLLWLLGDLYRERAMRADVDAQRRADDLQRALEAHRESLAKTPPGAPFRRNFVIEVANAIRDLPEPSESDLDQLVEVQGELVQLRREAGESTWPRSSNLLGDAYSARAAKRSDPDEKRADLEQARFAYRDAVEAADGEDELGMFLLDLANALFDLDERSAAEVEELIEVQSHLLRLRRKMGDPLWPQALNLLGDCYRERAALRGEEGEEDSARSLAIYREALAAVPQGSRFRLTFAIDYANSLFALDERSPTQLEELIATQAEIVELRKQADEDDWYLSGRLLGRAFTLRASSREAAPANREVDLRKALVAFEEALAALPPESELRVDFTEEMASVLGILDSRSKEEVDRLVELQQENLDKSRELGKDWKVAAFLAGCTYYERSQLDGAESKPEDLQAARKLLWEVLEADAEADLRIGCLIELSNSFGLPNERTDVEVEEAIAVQSELLELRRGHEGEDWTLTSNMLGDSYLEKSRRQKDSEVQEELRHQALRAYRDAFEAVSLSAENGEMFLMDLTTALRAVPQRTADEADELIEAQKQLLEHFWESGNPRWTQAANLLGDAYRDRSRNEEGQLETESEDYRNALTAYREAFSGAPDGSKERIIFATDLANSLLALSERTKGELDELIVVQGELAQLRREAEEEDWQVSSRLLGNALAQRAERKEEEGEPWEEDLRRALAAHRTALAETPADHEQRIGFVIGVVNALWGLKSRRSVAEIDELVELQKELVELKRQAGEPDWVDVSNLLGDAYAERARQQDDDEARTSDLRCALQAYRDAFEALPADGERPLTYVVDLANTMVLLAIATKEGGSGTLDEATNLVATETGGSLDQPELMRLLPVLRANIRRGGHWKA